MSLLTWSLIIVGIIGMGLLGRFVYLRQTKPVRLYLGVYTDSSWDVPNGNEYKLLDQVISQFEKSHPNVKISYESGITKDDYSAWLAEQVIKGQQPDIFILPQNDFNLLASTGALKKIDPYLSQLESGIFFNSALKAGSYNGGQYALPYETNPTMMCINKDLLEREGIKIPQSGWTFADFYKICKQVTKDTNHDGQIDQYGVTDYTWQQAMAAYQVSLFNDKGSQSYFNSEAAKKALAAFSQLAELTRRNQVTSDDFDEGKVAFLPMTLAQYRTYQPYPYHVTKYSTFSWTCVEMPSAKARSNATQTSTTLYAMSSKTKHSQLAWQFLKLLCADKGVQQELFKSSQGASVLRSVMRSPKTQLILKDDNFGTAALTADTLTNMLTDALVQPKFKKYNDVIDKADYLLTRSLRHQSIDSDLADIQRQIEDALK
nr:extracellular solute-binding protein [Streptococcus halichoeri]